MKTELRGLEEELEYHRENQASSDPDDHFVLVMDEFARKATSMFADLDFLISNMMEEVWTGDCVRMRIHLFFCVLHSSRRLWHSLGKTLLRCPLMSSS